jgi:hypothetical protein
MRHDMNYRRVLRTKEHFLLKYKYFALSVSAGYLSKAKIYLEVCLCFLVS